jgi:hypothetical protein
MGDKSIKQVKIPTYTDFHNHHLHYFYQTVNALITIILTVGNHRNLVLVLQPLPIIPFAKYDSSSRQTVYPVHQQTRN